MIALLGLNPILANHQADYGSAYTSLNITSSSEIQKKAPVDIITSKDGQFKYILPANSNYSKVTIYNVIGQELQSNKISGSTGSFMLRSNKAGLYVAIFSNQDGSGVAKKFVVN